MRVRLHLSGEPLELRPDLQLGSGGEARIFALPDDPLRVAKLWHRPTPERGRKVRAMLENPPVDPLCGQGQVAIAWPTDLLLLPGPNPVVAGFAMPRVTDRHAIVEFFNPRTRLQRCPLFTWFYLHRTARNLVTAIRALHDRGYVVGDLNESNILVSETALVTLVDTDSFQVWDAGSGTLFRCRVGRPEFTPPEMQGQSFARVNREPAQDHFGIAILIYQLLMEGTHPFAGVYHGTGEAPNYPERIAAGHFPQVANAAVPYSPMPAGPKFAWLNPILQDLFVRCFCDGHDDPGRRPDAVSWQYGLEEAEAALVSCHDNPQHVFGAHLQACPWCERTRMLGGRDPFPSPQAVLQGDHLKPPPPRPRTLPGPADPNPAGWPSVVVPQSRSEHTLPKPHPIPHCPARPRSSSAGTSGASDALRQAFGSLRRNEWAGAALVLSLLALAMVPWQAGHPLAVLLGIGGVLTGLAGEVHAGGWQCAGRGRRTARVAIVLSALALALR